MPQSNRILCRELSLLAFNRRVLAQAQDKRVPLLERLRFVCIVSSNLDEFFEVRMAHLKRKQRTRPNHILDSGLTPSETISRVSEEAQKLITEQYAILNKTLLPELEAQGIVFYRRSTWSNVQREWIEDYFNRELLPILTPIGLDASHPFPRLLNKSLNFVVELDGKDAFGRASGMAIVQAPRILPRAIKLPEEICNGKSGFVFLSSILHEYVYKLFRGMTVKGCHQFRLTRDSALTVDEDDLSNLRTAVQNELRDRDYGDGVRLEVADSCPNHISEFLLAQFQLTRSELYQVHGPVNLVRLNSVPDMLDRKDLKDKPYAPQYPKPLRKIRCILDEIAKQDILLHHPYQSFEPVVRFIRDAAREPDVVAIKMTIYRTGSNSELVRALMAASLAGKQVTVVMELMARFDEANNVNWAKQLEEAGAHVVYGVFGYKVHAKMALVIRRESDSLKAYAHLGTGNYHQGTSRIYTDFGLFTANEAMTRDVNTLFMEITGLGQANKLKKLYQSPFTLHKMVLDNIQRETENAKAGKPAKIIAKMNSLVEPQVIEALYAASAAGVQIDLIVRGMCALRPQVAGLSENIRVRSIIGRLLEHSRVYYFYNDGAENVFIASADWMGRNFFSRIEVCTPIETGSLKKRVIREGLTLALADNIRAWEMHGDGTYTRIAPKKDEEEIGLQETLLAEYAA
ncbi:polyphosphate kinase 1 [Kingella negevensis]|uniref:Polyphosphate kinase n=1 Tax=Kingella negevensis TaxID=1522312 RepID=A0A238TCS6_9NEIS|nr:polyphosphate kinase 1 [Kingella negevensis]MDK4685530.1 polyphosphate kinase 1 [Kingella negevensis]MDK4696999.1 polyphosphate kinase 1 [Kingella negevensis]MDK4708181.1 polyphosphate kinase 1 [Kingella negevensis]MDK4709746.1 polyphosphate kinase 1 [Kingella negevensis]SNB78320.1 Polyphosphate kinase [Kingella negevensis]